MMRTIENTVKYIRSKNAGPFWLTIDAFCNSVEDTEKVAAAFEREMIGLEPHDVIKVGEIEVEIVPVDHDAYGAAALLIRTPDHYIAYTGD